MNRTAKIWLIIAGIFVVLGPILIICATTIGGGLDFGNSDYETTTEEIVSTFDQIAIKTDITDIEIATADEKHCRMESTEPNKIEHSAQVQDGTLVIQSTDSRPWYEHIFNISFNSPKIKLYLPQSDYTSLKIDTHTGDVLIPAGFTADTLTINGDTSDVSCAANVKSLTVNLSTGDTHLNGASADQAEISSTTGDVKIDLLTSDGDVSVTTTTGDILMTDVSCQNFTAESTTGDITLGGILAKKDLKITCTTGDVIINGCDAAELAIKTGTGDVTGSLLSEKTFITDTSTGDIDVPHTTGGKCEITTSTGDIQITITK